MFVQYNVISHTSRERKLGNILDIILQIAYPLHAQHLSINIDRVLDFWKTHT